LGVSEEEIIRFMYEIIMWLIELEEETRELIHKEAFYQTEDKIWRAFGILKNARILNSEETLNLLLHFLFKELVMQM
jgi:protein arginine kinase